MIIPHDTFQGTLFLCYHATTLPILHQSHNPLVALSLEAAKLYRTRGGSSGPAGSFTDDELKYFRAQEEHLASQKMQRSNDANESPSVFLIMLESVRASSLPVYNHAMPPELTPFLSSLTGVGKRGGSEGKAEEEEEEEEEEEGRVWVVESLYAGMPNTMKSLFASLCGVPPHPTPRWAEFSSSFLDFCLPRVLQTSQLVPRLLARLLLLLFLEYLYTCLLLLCPMNQRLKWAGRLVSSRVPRSVFTLVWASKKCTVEPTWLRGTMKVGIGSFPRKTRSARQTAAAEAAAVGRRSDSSKPTFSDTMRT